MQVSAVAKARLFSHGAQLHSGSNMNLVFVMRGGVGLHEDKVAVKQQQVESDAQHSQQPSAQALTQDKQEQTAGTRQAAKLGQHHQYSQRLDPQDQQQRQSKCVLDARGYVSGLAALLQEQPSARVTAVCHSDVEAYVVPAKVMQVR